MAKHKRPVKATSLTRYVVTNTRQPGEAPRPDHYYVIASFRVDDEPGTPRQAVVNITMQQLAFFLRDMPTPVKDEIIRIARREEG